MYLKAIQLHNKNKRNKINIIKVASAGENGEIQTFCYYVCCFWGCKLMQSFW